MTGLTQFFIEEMGEEVIELACTGMVNILKYVPGVQGVDNAVRPWFLARIPDELKTQKICEKSVAFNPYVLGFLLDHFKTKKMCERAVQDEPSTLEFVPDCFKDQEMCEKAVEEHSCMLEDVPDHLKMRKMCDAIVMKDSLLLRYVSDWFVTQKQLKIWHDDDGYFDDDELIEQYKSYKKRKTQKASIKEELLPIVLASIKLLGLMHARR